MAGSALTEFPIFFLAFTGVRFHIRAMSIAASMPLPPEIARIASATGRIVLTRDGEPVAAVVTVADLRALEELDDAEDAYLSRVAAEAVAQWEAEGRPAGVSHEELMARYGITPDAA